MSRSQWNIKPGLLMVATYPSPGLSGAAMLQLQTTTVGTDLADITVMPTSGLTHGVAAGRLRCLFLVTGSWGPSYPNNHFGLVCLSADDTPNSGAFEGYGVLVEHNGIMLRKGNQAGPVSSAPIIASHPQGYVPGTLISLEVEWQAQSALFQTDIIVRRGQRVDYGDLTQIISFQDTISPIFSGAWECVTCRQTIAAEADYMRFQIDKTTLYLPSA